MLQVRRVGELQEEQLRGRDRVDAGRVGAARQDVEAVQAQSQRRMVDRVDDAPGVLVGVDVGAPRQRLVTEPHPASRAASASTASCSASRRRRGRRRGRRCCTPASVRRRAAPSRRTSVRAAQVVARPAPGRWCRRPGTAGRGRWSDRGRRSGARTSVADQGDPMKSGSKISTPSKPAAAAAASSLSSRVPEMQTVAMLLRHDRVAAARRSRSTGVRRHGHAPSSVVGCRGRARRSRRPQYPVGAAGLVGVRTATSVRVARNTPRPGSSPRAVPGSRVRLGAMPTDPLEMTRELAERAAAVLAPETDLFEDSDAAGLRAALISALRSAAAHPAGPGPRRAHAEQPGWRRSRSSRPGTSSAGRPSRRCRSTRRTAGSPPPPGTATRRSTRCGWRIWRARSSPARWSPAPRSRPTTPARRAIMVDLLVDAVAPTNFLATNPAALIKAFETGGASVLKGARTLPGRPAAQRRPAAPGRHLGLHRGRQPGLHAGKGRLPQRADGADPVLAADRRGARGAAAVQPAVDQQVLHHGPRAAAELHRMGRPARPDGVRDQLPQLRPREMAHTTMDDYLVHGPQAALDVVCEITGAPTVDIVGLCLGGAMTAITAAWLTPEGDSRIGTLTLLNTMLDYREPGALKAFTDERDRRPAREEDGQNRRAGGGVDGRHLRRAARQRPDLQLRGLQLADGPAAAGVRHPGLERRQHPDAGRHARLLPAQLLRAEQPGQGRPRARRQDASTSR